MTDKTKSKFWPSWRYHPVHEPRIFQSQAELDAAGPGWVDSPAKFGKPTHPTSEELAQMQSPVKGRLSKLQKWVIQETYKGSESAGEGDYRLSRKTIYQNYFGIKCEYIDGWQFKFRFAGYPGNKPVILSRSLTKLKKMGYIRVSRYYLALTEKGIEKAKELLKV